MQVYNIPVKEFLILNILHMLPGICSHEELHALPVFPLNSGFMMTCN